MPSRRSHGRSHHGCAQCKQRRIKCDEIHPRCGPCSRGQLACAFESYAETSIPRPLSPMGQLPLLELELLHHWHVATAPSLWDSRWVQDTMRSLVVEMGLSNPSLMNSVLAVAALHRARSAAAPEQRRTYTEAAMKYHDASLRLSTPLLQAITPRNCHTLFALSCLVSMFVLAARGPCMDSTGEPRMTDMVEAFRILRGSASVAEYARHWIERGPLSHLLRVGRQTKPVPSGHCAYALFTQLDSFGRRTTDVDTACLAQRAIRELAHLVHIYLDSGDPNAIMSWPIVVDSMIFDSMLANERVSLIALGFYGAALGIISGCWWLDGWSGLLDRLARERLSIEDQTFFDITTAE